MRERLIRYLLGELDPAETEQIETLIAADLEIRAELERLRACMDEPELIEPPGDLAGRTCDVIWAQFREEELAPSRQWRWQDTLVAAGICLAAALLIFPAINHSRGVARVTWCSYNLQQLSLALTSYSDNFGGYFPAIPQEGKLATASVYAPILVENGYLPDPDVLVCPGNAICRDEPFAPPTLAQLVRAEGQEYEQLKRNMAGSYGYTLGYYDGQRYRDTRNLRRVTFALVADSPSLHLTGFQSANHGGTGQNVLFEAGNVSFCTTPHLDQTADGIFTNARGYVTAGTGRDDSVIGDRLATPRQPLPASF